MTFPEFGVNRGFDVKNCVAWTDAELYAAVSKAIGKNVQVVNHTPEEHVKLLESWGQPRQLAENLVGMDTIRRMGWAAATDTTEFKRLVGRPQISADEWAQKHAAELKHIAA